MRDTTVDPDTLEQDRQILGSIVKRFGAMLALNASVIQGRTLIVENEFAGPPRRKV